MAIASVIGVGIIPFGKHSEKSILEMGAKAGYLALKDAGIDPLKIQAGFFANGLAGRLTGKSYTQHF